MKSKLFYIWYYFRFFKNISILNTIHSPTCDTPTIPFNKNYTGPSLLSDDIFDQVDELFEGSDEDKLKAYEILLNLNEEVSNIFFIKKILKILN